MILRFRCFRHLVHVIAIISSLFGISEIDVTKFIRIRRNGPDEINAVSESTKLNRM
jgi:predicted transcriptional regulator